jgi:NAD(P)-dependent dehydrogenase (short-subunit alcohol dehydrogenase family)
MAQLKKQGVHTFEVDFTDEESIAAAAKAFGDKPLDILVNCAGTRSNSSFIPKAQT